MSIDMLDGRAIQIGRAFRGWSQRRLADVSGLKTHRVWQLENNVGTPNPEELSKILKALSTGE